MRGCANYLLILSLLGVAGCATPKPEIRYVSKPVRVEVPVVIPCGVVMPDAQVYETSMIYADSSDFDKIKAVLVELRQREAAERELRSLLGECLKVD